MQLQWVSRFLTVWGTVFNSDDKNSYSQLEVSQWYNYQSYEIVQGWLRMEKPRLETYFLEGAVWNYFLRARGELVRDVKWWEIKLMGLGCYFGNLVFRLETSAGFWERDLVAICWWKPAWWVGALELACVICKVMVFCCMVWSHQLLRWGA